MNPIAVQSRETANAATTYLVCRLSAGQLDAPGTNQIAEVKIRATARTPDVGTSERCRRTIRGP